MNRNWLMAVSPIAFLVVPSLPAQAQPGPVTRWMENQWQYWQQGHRTPIGYNLNVSTRAAQPMTRDGLSYLNYLGGGIDDRGYYHRPIPSQQVFPGLTDGTYRMPMAWDDQDGRSILLDIQGGYVVRQDFQWQR